MTYAVEYWFTYFALGGNMIKTSYIILLLALLFASLSDLLIPVIIGRKYPGYHHHIHTISTLGTKDSPVKKQQCLNLIIVGLLFLVFAIGQYFFFKYKTWAVNWYTIGILIFGIGCILAGLFPEDIKNTPETINGKIHGIASGIGFLFLIMNPIWAISIKDFGCNRIINSVLFVIGIVTFALFIISENKERGFLKYTGLFQRMNLIALYMVLILNYVVLRKIFET